MIIITAKVNPGSKQEGVTLQPHGEWHIKIHAKPVHGEANEYLIEFLANTFHLRKSVISIQKGAHSRIKKIQLDISDIQWQKILSTFSPSNNFFYINF